MVISGCIDLFSRKEKKYIYKEILKKVILISSPLLMIFSLITFIYSILFFTISLLIFLVIFFNKKIFNKSIYMNVRFFINIRNGKFKFSEIIQIIFLTIRTYKYDLGYIKGFFKFNNIEWNRSKQL